MGHQVAVCWRRWGLARASSPSPAVCSIFFDIDHYLSLVGVFVALNVFNLERLRWAGNPGARRHRLWVWLMGLAAANLVVANLWLAPVDWARVDLTEDNRYSLSKATERQLAQLQEPLLHMVTFPAKLIPCWCCGCRASGICW
ncbi:MAG: hypothetical protein U5K56_05110 [Halioglobus sp.]|nr:hypothetical protein [Halioglobus sp.]